MPTWGRRGHDYGDQVMAKNSWTPSAWQSNRRDSVLKRSRGLINLISRAALVGLVSLTVINVWTTAMTQHVEPPSNPLATFADVFPDQPKSAVDIRGFSCYGNPFTNAVKENCTLELVSGAFTQVQVSILDEVIDLNLPQFSGGKSRDR